MKFKLLILYYWLEFRFSRLRYRHTSDLVRLQQHRLQRLFRHLRKAPFYANLAQRQAALDQYPLLDKARMMAHFNTINTVGIDREEALTVAIRAENSRDFSSTIQGITIGLSSGTSGNKGLFLASEQERARWVACVLDRVIGLQLRKRKVAFFLRANSQLYESVASRLLQFRFFDILEPMPQLLADLETFQAQLLVAQPSVLREIALAVESGQISLSLEKIVSVAEVLEPEDRHWFSQVFRQSIHEVYQCTEGFLAATCSQGTLHFNEDFLLIEKRWLDEAQTRFHPIITDLYRRSQPVVRYELNDIIRSGEPCACGSHFLPIAQIEGRSDDVLTLPGKSGLVRVFPDFVRRAIITASDAVSFYQVIQVGKAQLNCYLEWQSEATSAAAEEEKISAQLQTLFTKLGIQPVEIQFVQHCAHQQGNKLRRVQNDYQISRQTSGNGDLSPP